MEAIIETVFNTVIHPNALILYALLLLYLLPSIVAFGCSLDKRYPIALVNVFLGWTVLGWIGALIWSFHSLRK